MKQEFTEGQTFSKSDYTINPLTTGDYDGCTFLNCDFSDSELSNIKFMDCRFEYCNMSMARLNRTVLRDIVFSNCKMLGLQFENCSEHGLSARFENCNLSHSSFCRIKLKKTTFRNCTFHGADFTGCDLSGSLDSCDLKMALFEGTNLEKTDFVTSVNYSIDPERNRIKKARFSIAGIAGLLDKYQIEINY